MFDGYTWLNQYFCWLNQHFSWLFPHFNVTFTSHAPILASVTKAAPHRGGVIAAEGIAEAVVWSLGI
jgi:hypothetical protein